MSRGGGKGARISLIAVRKSVQACCEDVAQAQILIERTNGSSVSPSLSLPRGIFLRRGVPTRVMPRHTPSIIVSRNIRETAKRRKEQKN